MYICAKKNTFYYLFLLQLIMNNMAPEKMHRQTSVSLFSDIIYMFICVYIYIYISSDKCFVSSEHRHLK